MKRKILIILLAVVVACTMTVTFTACEQHKCGSVCPECKLCLSDCGDAACSKKCKGHQQIGGGGGENPNEEGEGFTVTFVCDSNVTVYVYETQDMSGDGEETNTAYSRNGETGALLKDGNGQVNFKIVFANGYELKDIVITEGYNNLKGSSDTGIQYGYRITKITANLTVTVTSQLEGTQEDLTQGYKITFEHDEHVSVVVYKTQDMTNGGEKTDIAYSRESGTGTLNKDGGQVNFVLVFDEGYELGSISATAGAYKNIKYPHEIDVANGFRITQITGELTVTITSQEEGTAEDLTQGYEVTFVCGEHVKIIVYRTQDTSGEGEQTNTAHSRDGKSGVLLKNGEGQVNFKIVCDEGWEVSDITIEGTYSNNKPQGDNIYRITKIASDLVVTITVTAVS